MWIELVKEFLGKSPGERLYVSDSEGQQLVTLGTAKSVSDDPLTPVITRGVENALAGFQKGLDGIITATLKQFADAQSQARKIGQPVLFGASSEGDPKRSFGDWALAVARNDQRYLENHYKSSFVAWQTKAALAEASGVTGGYTVPPEFYQQLQAIMAEQTFIRSRAFIVPMSSATMQMPYIDITTVQSAGVSPFFGGVQMTWTAEAQTRTETEPAFKQMELKAWELSGYSVSSNVLLQDSIMGLEKFLMTLFAQAIAWFEEYAFLQGNGVGKPLGMMNAPATVTVSRNTSNSILFNDISTMWSKLLPASWNKAIWTCSPSVVPQLLQLKDGNNRSIFLQISGDGGGAITKTPVWSLLGRPIYPTEKVAPLGTKGDLMLLDPSLYVIGDRMSIEVAASQHVNFLKNQMTWRVVERVDGQPWLSAPVTLQDASTQVSPFVTLV